jgi:prophage antirepressor-like protein
MVDLFPKGTCQSKQKQRFAHVDDEDKTSTLIQGSGSNYKSQAVFINESGLYSLILSSKPESAKRFKHWVTSEVFPSICKMHRSVSQSVN